MSVLSNPEIGIRLVEINYYSMSGDWLISAIHLFNEENELTYIDWSMNTFHAIEPITVRKRIKFSQGSIESNYIQTFKMNTDEEFETEFYDQKVQFELQFEKMDFYRTWLSEFNPSSKK